MQFKRVSVDVPSFIAAATMLLFAVGLNGVSVIANKTNEAYA
jgi:hypothetical protein